MSHVLYNNVFTISCPSKFGCFTDEGNPEQIKKKMKALNDRISELTNTNDALSGAVRAMRKERAAARHDTNSERGNSDNDEDDGVDNNSPMLFKSRNVRTLNFSLLFG